MALTPTERSANADAQAARLQYVSLHTADPGTTGASEATGGTPAYARKAVTFPAATTGSATATAVTFDIPAGTYTHFGFWSAATGGTFRGGGAISGTATPFASQGKLEFTPTLAVS